MQRTVKTCLWSAFLVGVLLGPGACADEAPPPSNGPPERPAGTLDRPLVYRRLEAGEFEAVLADNQPFTRFTTDSGIQAFLLSASMEGDVPNAPHPIMHGVLRAGIGEPWYCVGGGTFEYLPRLESMTGGSATLAGLTRLSDCAGGRYDVSFAPSSAAIARRERAEGTFPLLGLGVVTGNPSPGTWLFSAPFGDFYLALDGNVSDASGGFVIAMGRDIGTTTFRFGLACIESSRRDGDGGTVSGISDVRWCPGTVPVDGEVVLRP